MAARAEAAWLAGDDATARAEAQSGLAAAKEHTDPWLVGHLRRWAHLAGGVVDDAPTVDTVTPYRLEVSEDWQGAAAEWTRLGCPYDAAIARLGGDVAAALFISPKTANRHVGAILTKLGVRNRTQAVAKFLSG